MYCGCFADTSYVVGCSFGMKIRNSVHKSLGARLVFEIDGGHLTDVKVAAFSRYPKEGKGR